MNLGKTIRTFYFTGTALRVCGLLFLASGMLGYLIQVNILDVDSVSNMELFHAMQADPALVIYAAFALAGQVLEACAVPIFAFLMVEGTVYTSNFGRYFLRVLGLAVVSQLPYNLVTTGSFLKFYCLNPVFAFVMSMIMLYFFQRFPRKNVSNIAMKCIAVLFAYLWSNILGISHGAACIIITSVLWAFKSRQNLRIFLGVIATLCCTIISVYYLMAPISFLFIYFYTGQQGHHKRIVNYAAYPILLLIFGLISALCC